MIFYLKKNTFRTNVCQLIHEILKYASIEVSLCVGHPVHVDGNKWDASDVQ